MKKIMFLLSLMLVLFSCEQENTLSEISTDNNENEVPLTRNSSDHPHLLAPACHYQTQHLNIS